MQHERVCVKYRDLFEKFKQVLMAEVRTDQTEEPLVMALNAFRGFLDGFMKRDVGRRQDKKEERSKAEKPKREKPKKDFVVSGGFSFGMQQLQLSSESRVCMCSGHLWFALWFTAFTASLA